LGIPLESRRTGRRIKEEDRSAWCSAANIWMV
jgi:hypothetical protein